MYHKYEFFIWLGFGFWRAYGTLALSYDAALRAFQLDKAELLGAMANNPQFCLITDCEQSDETVNAILGEHYSDAHRN